MTKQQKNTRRCLELRTTPPFLEQSSPATERLEGRREERETGSKGLAAFGPGFGEPDALATVVEDREVRPHEDIAQDGGQPVGCAGGPGKGSTPLHILGGQSYLQGGLELSGVAFQGNDIWPSYLRCVLGGLLFGMKSRDLWVRRGP